MLPQPTRRRAEVDLDGACFADLYAGSGAVGLEALSRGARH
ncbi:RsmD family RNA methyltransferase, partial [Micromonospora luteifusca]